MIYTQNDMYNNNNKKVQFCLIVIIFTKFQIQITVLYPVSLESVAAAAG